jgi:hypothetical protein
MKEKTKRQHQNQFNSSSTTPEPEFMNDIFCLFLKIVNFVSAIYIIFSIILYFVIHFHGKDLFKSKKSYTEYDSLLFLNLYYDIFLAFSIVISFFAVSKKSILLYVLYWNLMILSCVFGFYGNSIEINTLNSKFKYIVLTLFGLNVLLGMYPIFHYLRKVQYFRVSLESFPVENIIHEIKLRTDMMKIGFNNFVIRMKLNKIFTSLTFKKEDYYFLSEECQNRIAYRPIENREDKDEIDDLTDRYYSKPNEFDSQNFHTTSTKSS